jgi:hypothetical protein
MIKFDRRSFFAALAAPFVARFLPKPKATGGLFNPHTEIPVQYYCRALIRETEIAVSEEMLHYLGFKCAVGTGTKQRNPEQLTRSIIPIILNQ